ncbi:MAG: OmpH family outer membrane protein [Planctomycetota bacterium]
MFRPNTQTLILALTLVALMLGLGLAPLVNDLASREADPTVVYRAPSMATVDMEEVISDFIDQSGAFDSLRNTFNSKRRALQELAEELRSMKQEAGVYVRQSSEYFEIAAKIRVKEAQLKFNQEVNQAQYDSQQATLTKETFEKVRAIVEDIAKRRNIDMVLMKQTGKVLGKQMSEVSSSIVVRTVLYAKGSIDITQDVKNAMK